MSLRALVAVLVAVVTVASACFGADKGSHRYSTPSAALAAPTLPTHGLSHACGVCGAPVLVLPDSSRDAVQVRASPCTQGGIDKSLLYATVSRVAIHAGLWTTHG